MTDLTCEWCYHAWHGQDVCTASDPSGETDVPPIPCDCPESQTVSPACPRCGSPVLLFREYRGRESRHVLSVGPPQDPEGHRDIEVGEADSDEYLDIVSETVGCGQCEWTANFPLGEVN